MSRRPLSGSPSHRAGSGSKDGHVPLFLFATTRGKTTDVRGYLCAFKLDVDGLIISVVVPSNIDDGARQLTVQSNTDASAVLAPSEHPAPIHLFKTPTSGGKANAISVAPYSISSSAPSSTCEDAEWLVLTDDEQGLVFIIEWSGARGRFEEISRVRLSSIDGKAGADGQEEVMASHAIWLE